MGLLTLPILFGMASALIWGGADFTGGLASRRADAFRVVMFSEMAGLGLLLAAAWVLGEPRPGPSALAWSAAAGALGCMGLVALFQAFAEGRMSIASPVSALTAAVVPVAAGSLLESLPGPLTIAGFGLALIAIWLVSQSSTGVRLRRASDLGLPLLSGLFFGIYFILMDRGSQDAVLWPMIASRTAGTLTVAALVLARRQPLLPGRGAWPFILLAGALDVIGNAFFVLAAQTGRLDVAAVLGSLYPGTTVVLAWLLLRERITRTQLAGILLALAAIVLLTL